MSVTIIPLMAPELTLENNQVYIYVLRLKSPAGEPPRYYVGSAKDYKARVEAHFSGEGAAYSQKYTPVELVSVKIGTRYDEDATARHLMATHGIDYVRGGAYSRLHLTAEEKMTIQHEIWAAEGLCVNCGKGNHFAINCYAPKKETKLIEARNVAPNLQKVSQTVAPNLQTVPQPIDPTVKCLRCGRRGHLTESCFTKVENISCENCWQKGHHTSECSVEKLEPKINKIDEITKKLYKCFRCGNNGHTSNVCYSKFDIDGELITTTNKFFDSQWISASTIGNKSGNKFATVGNKSAKIGNKSAKIGNKSAKIVNKFTNNTWSVLKDSDESDSSEEYHVVNKPITCFRCKKKGHHMRDCA